MKNLSKKILMVLQSEYPPDIRLFKEIKALNSESYTVFLLSNNKSGLPQKEVVDGATVLRLKPFTTLPSKFRTLINIPLFFNPVWLLKILVSVIKYRINVIHVHDLPLALSGIIVGKICNIPVIFDIHENYPAALEVWGKKGIFPGLFRNPKLARMLENLCTKSADRIIVVVEEHKKLLIGRGIKPEKIHIVGNTVEHDVYMNLEINQQILDKYKKDFVLVYIGNFSPERDLETAIRAIKFLNHEIPELKLVLVGKGAIQGHLEKLAHEDGVRNRIEFAGWVDVHLTPSYIHAADICIIPQPSNPLIDNGVPHKLFQYMAMGKPIVVSDAKALARIVTECKCGEIFKSHSPEDFAKSVLRIHNTDINYGKNGKQAVMNKYNWETSSRELLKLYDIL